MCAWRNVQTLFFLLTRPEFLEHFDKKDKDEEQKRKAEPQAPAPKPESNSRQESLSQQNLQRQLQQIAG